MIVSPPKETCRRRGRRAGHRCYTRGPGAAKRHSAQAPELPRHHRRGSTSARITSPPRPGAARTPTLARSYGRLRVRARSPMHERVDSPPTPTQRLAHRTWARRRRGPAHATDDQQLRTRGGGRRGRPAAVVAAPVRRDAAVRRGPRAVDTVISGAPQPTWGTGAFSSSL